MQNLTKKGKTVTEEHRNLDLKAKKNMDLETSDVAHTDTNITCGPKFNTPSSMQKLMCDTVYACNACDQTFGSPCEMFEHNKVHFIGLQTKEKCPSLIQPSLHGSRPTSVIQQSEDAGNPQELKEDPQGKVKKSHKCKICDMCFPCHETLRAHFVKHTGPRGFQCEQCGKAFVRPSQLKKHMISHSNERPYQCEQCGRSFAMPSQLQRHMISHSSARPYQCEQCGRCFTRDSALQLHVISHSGEKPFQCDICAKAFSHRWNLKTHLRIHTGEKRFQCKTCSKYLSGARELANHQQKHESAKLGSKKRNWNEESGTKELSSEVDFKSMGCPGKLFKCELCRKGFAKERGLRLHETRVHY